MTTRSQARKNVEKALGSLAKQDLDDAMQAREENAFIENLVKKGTNKEAAEACTTIAEAHSMDATTNINQVINELESEEERERIRAYCEAHRPRLSSDETEELTRFVEHLLVDSEAIGTVRCHPI